MEKYQKDFGTNRKSVCVMVKIVVEGLGNFNVYSMKNDI